MMHLSPKAAITLKCLALAAGVIVAWDASRDAKKAGTNEIGMGPISAQYTNLSPFKGAAIAAKIENLPLGVSYLAVRYKDERGVSDWSNEISITNATAPTGAFSIVSMSAAELASILPAATNIVSLFATAQSNAVTISAKGDAGARVSPLVSTNLLSTNWEELLIEPLTTPASITVTNKGQEFFRGLVLPKY